MRLLPRLEDKQKPCASCQTYSVRVPKVILSMALSQDFMNVKIIFLKSQ